MAVTSDMELPEHVLGLVLGFSLGRGAVKQLVETLLGGCSVIHMVVTQAVCGAALHLVVVLPLQKGVVEPCQLPQLLEQGKLPTLNDGRYLLTEFPIDTPAQEFLPLLQEILTHGCIPLVAHPERYMGVCEYPQIVEDWLVMGCHIQLTGGSVLGEYGKTVGRTAAYLLQQDLVACIASDAHGLHRRSNFLLDVYDHLSLRYSKHYAQCLMYETPMGICCDNDI